MRALLILVLVALASPVAAARLYVGTATTSITPDQPVALSGQRHVRISQRVETPCTATVLALESRDGEKIVDQAVFVSCDLVSIPDALIAEVRRQLRDKSTGIDVGKIILSATHTHTAPVMEEGKYVLPKEGVMQPADYFAFLSAQLVEAIAKAWDARRPGEVGFGLGHAVAARNRIALYTDGHAQMYGSVNQPNFHRFEGYEDHGVDVLFFWDKQDKLIATAVNVACPAQEVEGRSTVNADFWHSVRELLRKRFGDELAVLGWTGPGGDQSPHLQLRKAAEARMQRLRGTTSLDDIARRIVYAWDEAYDGAKHEKYAAPEFAHTVATVPLLLRQVTQEQMLAAKAKAASFADDPKEEWNRRWHQRVVDRYEKQQPGDTQPMELHVVRLGDTAIATNEFELYTDYGIRMRARSPALQTFLIQLAGPGSYLPADRSIAGGAYGSVLQSGMVSPDGGQALVEETISAMNTLWNVKP